MKVLVIPAGADEYGQWHVLNLWPHYGKWFEAAAEESDGEYTTQSLAERVASGQSRLWTFWDDALQRCLGAGAVEVVTQESGGVFALIQWIAGEELAAWKHFLPEVEAWAAAQGAERMRYARHGSGKKPVLGYEVRCCVYEKDLI